MNSNDVFHPHCQHHHHHRTQMNVPRSARLQKADEESSHEFNDIPQPQSQQHQEQPQLPVDHCLDVLVSQRKQKRSRSCIRILLPENSNCCCSIDDAIDSPSTKSTSIVSKLNQQASRSHRRCDLGAIIAAATTTKAQYRKTASVAVLVVVVCCYSCIVTILLPNTMCVSSFSQSTTTQFQYTITTSHRIQQPLQQLQLQLQLQGQQHHHITTMARATSVTESDDTTKRVSLVNNRNSNETLFINDNINSANLTTSSSTSKASNKKQRVIPPTEIEIQKLKQIRQEAYEKVCGPSSMIDYHYINDDDNETDSIIIIDAGATFNATKDLLLYSIENKTATLTTATNSNTAAIASDNVMSSTLPNTTSIMGNLSSPIPVPTNTLDNVYITLNNTINITSATTIINDTSTLPKKKKKNVASIWSFESLFPEPVWDLESIEKDLYRNTNRTNSTTSIPASTRKISPTTVSSNVRSKDYLSQPIVTAPTLQQQQRLTNSINASSNTKSTSTNNVATFLYGGSGVIRKEKKPQQYSSYINTTITATTVNTNSTGKVDPRLTRMVEDRVNGYRRLPTGVLQYETSLVNPDGAIQFRNGVRLGNPLPINADILTYLAKKELQRGRVEEACELYERAISIDPSDGRAYLGLSKCAERRRDFTLARKWLVQGINRSVSVQQQRSVNNNNNNNNNKNNKKNNDDKNQYTEPVALIPDRGANPFLLQALGCLEEKLGRLTQAEALYAEAVKSRPYHTAAWVSLAVLRTRKLGYSVRAGRECYQCAERELQIANQPPSAFVYTSWANLEYNKANDKNRARELFQKAIEIDPQCSAALLQLGVLEAACQNWDAAEQCFESVLKFDQRNTRVLQAYAIMETKRPSGDSRKAIGLFERAIQTNPRDAGIYQPYALYVAQLGDLKMARSLLQKGTQVNKRHAAAWQAWGVLETRYGDADTARNIFQEGIWSCGQLSGSQSGGYQCDRLWQAWGVLEAGEGQYAEARRCFSRALDANNRNVPAFTAWALMEEQLGNVKDARMIFERGLRYFSPGSEEKKALYRSYELMEQRLGETTAAQNIYQRSVRESFTEKDDFDVLKSNVIVNSISNLDTNVKEDMSTVITGTKKKTKEFEVVRWENSGGEVWLNDRAIEAKVSMKKATKAKAPPPSSPSTTTTKNKTNL